jgi:5-methyltetrahydrofolate--homocysteine methyltransferase
MATMTFNKNPRGFFTIMGNTIETAARELEAAGADIIGSNCGNGIVNMIEIAKEFKKFSPLPLVIQSNAGLPEIKDDLVVYPETPGFMAEKSKELAAAGVSIIGGCCGTTPEHIRAIAHTARTS